MKIGISSVSSVVVLTLLVSFADEAVATAAVANTKVNSDDETTTTNALVAGYK